MGQKIISAENNYLELDHWFLNYGLEKVLLVCGKSITRQKINEYFAVAVFVQLIPKHIDICKYQISACPDFACTVLLDQAEIEAEVERRAQKGFHIVR